MSMNATDDVESPSATLRATVDFPEPDPPAIPMMNGFTLADGSSSKAGVASIARWERLLVPGV